MDSYMRLAKRIVSSPIMTAEDRQVVKDILFNLSLDAKSYTDMNTKWEGQQSIEADVLYLLGEYRDKWQENQFRYEEEEAGIMIDDVPSVGPTGKKTTVKETKAYIAVNPDLAVLRRELYQYSSLFQDIQNLVKYVFARNDKLDNINVNYRRELKADERS